MPAHVVEEKNVRVSPVRKLVVEILKQANEEMLDAVLVVFSFHELEKLDAVA